MKKIVYGALFTVGSFLISGCSLFEKVDDVTFDVEITHTFVIDENMDSQGNPVSYSDVDAIDPKTNSDFNKYKDKIKEITVNKITYTVSDYEADGAVSFTNGTGKFKATASGTTALGSAGISFQNIQASVGGNFELTYAVSDLNAIANHLEKVEPVYFEVAGTFSKTPVAFKVPVTIHCTIKADAL